MSTATLHRIQQSPASTQEQISVYTDALNFLFNSVKCPTKHRPYLDAVIGVYHASQTPDEEMTAKLFDGKLAARMMGDSESFGAIRKKVQRARAEFLEWQQSSPFELITHETRKRTSNGRTLPGTYRFPILDVLNRILQAARGSAQWTRDPGKTLRRSANNHANQLKKKKPPLTLVAPSPSASKQNTPGKVKRKVVSALRAVENAGLNLAETITDALRVVRIDSTRTFGKLDKVDRFVPKSIASKRLTDIGYFGENVNVENNQVTDAEKIKLEKTLQFIENRSVMAIFKLIDRYGEIVWEGAIPEENTEELRGKFTEAINACHGVMSSSFECGPGSITHSGVPILSTQGEHVPTIYKKGHVQDRNQGEDQPMTISEPIARSSNLDEAILGEDGNLEEVNQGSGNCLKCGDDLSGDQPREFVNEIIGPFCWMCAPDARAELSPKVEVDFNQTVQDFREFRQKIGDAIPYAWQSDVWEAAYKLPHLAPPFTLLELWTLYARLNQLTEQDEVKPRPTS